MAWYDIGNIIGTLGSVGGAITSLFNPLVGASIAAGSNAIASASRSEANTAAQKQANAQNMAINQQNLEFNREQNDLSRQFNASEAEKSRQFNSLESQIAFDRSAKFAKEMWQMENEYNSPSSQVQRLISAGLNPNLFGGNNTAGSVGSAASSAASSSPASSSALGSPSSIGAAPVSYVNPSLEIAQANLMQAQADNLKANTDESKERVNDLRALRQGKLDLQNVEIHLGLSQERLNDFLAGKCLKECESIDSNIKVAQQNLLNLKQELANMQLSGKLSQKELDAFDTRLQLNIANALAETAYKYGLVNVSRKQCELLASQITGQSISNGLIAIDFNKAVEAAPASTGVTISLLSHQQNRYDWESGDWFNKVWGSDRSIPRKIWLTGSAWSNWLFDAISFGANATVTDRSTVNKSLR